MNIVTLKDKKFKLYINENNIIIKINEVAEKINNDFKDKELVIICVLKGSFMFFSDLIKKINVKCTIDFIKLSSYEKTKSTGKIKNLMNTEIDVKDKHILIVEDIIDTGNTINYLINYFTSLEAKSLNIATLFFKKNAYQYTKNPDYVAMFIPNKFIVGYGLDYDQYGRNLTDIYELI